MKVRFQRDQDLEAGQFSIVDVVAVLTHSPNPRFIVGHVLAYACFTLEKFQ